MSNSRTVQNLYEGSYLLCKGFKITGKRRDAAKVSITFQGLGVEEEAMRFYNGGANVEAKAFADAYRTLKDFVFER